MHDSVSRKRALTDLNLTAYERYRVRSNTQIKINLTKLLFLTESLLASIIILKITETLPDIEYAHWYQLRLQNVIVENVVFGQFFLFNRNFCGIFCSY